MSESGQTKFHESQEPSAIHFGKMKKYEVVNLCFGNTSKKRMVNIGDHKLKLHYKRALLQTFSSERYCARFWM